MLNLIINLYKIRILKRLIKYRTITILCDFLLNNIQIGKLNKKSKKSIFNILTGNEVNVTEDMCYEEKLTIYITKHILYLKQEEERLLNNLH